MIVKWSVSCHSPWGWAETTHQSILALTSRLAIWVVKIYPGFLFKCDCPFGLLWKTIASLIGTPTSRSTTGQLQWGQCTELWMRWKCLHGRWMGAQYAKEDSALRNSDLQNYSNRRLSSFLETFHGRLDTQSWRNQVRWIDRKKSVFSSGICFVAFHLFERQLDWE